VFILADLILICEHKIVKTMRNKTLKNRLFKTGAILMTIAIILGAFGSHLFKKHMDEGYLNAFETAVRYMVYHGLALLILSSLQRRLRTSPLNFAFNTMLIGLFIFSGSIIIMSVSSIWLGDMVRWIGMITPIGGLLLIFSWFWLATKSLKSEDEILREGSQDTK
jgi:uncharacterized membrane protein YgdD (TMEM256/DUF423 family)